MPDEENPKWGCFCSLCGEQILHDSEFIFPHAEAHRVEMNDPTMKVAFLFYDNGEVYFERFD